MTLSSLYITGLNSKGYAKSPAGANYFRGEVCRYNFEVNNTCLTRKMVPIMGRASS